jgi:hypothetical protein
MKTLYLDDDPLRCGWFVLKDPTACIVHSVEDFLGCLKERAWNAIVYGQKFREQLTAIGFDFGASGTTTLGTTCRA